MATAKRPRKQYRPKAPGSYVFSPFDVMVWTTTPLAALQTLNATGRITADDFGALQCVIRIVEGNAEAFGIPCPNSAAIRGLVAQLDAGMPIHEERILLAIRWVKASAQWLRGKPTRPTAFIVDEITREIAKNVQTEEIRSLRRILMRRPASRAAA